MKKILYACCVCLLATGVAQAVVISFTALSDDITSTDNTLSTDGFMTADAELSVTGAASGNDYIYSVIYKGSDYDGDTVNDTLTFEVLVQGWDGSVASTTFTDSDKDVNANNGTATIGTTDRDVTLNNNGWSVFDGLMDAGETLEFSLQNLSVTGTTLGHFTASLDAFTGTSYKETGSGYGHIAVIGEGPTAIDLFASRFNATTYNIVGLLNETDTLLITSAQLNGLNSANPQRWNVLDVDFDISVIADPKWTGSSSALWGNTANWDPASVPGTGETAAFVNAGNGNTTIDLDTGVTINNMIFFTSSAAAYTIGSGAVNAQSLTLENGGSITLGSTVGQDQLVNANVILGNDATASTYTLANASAGTLTLAGTVTGATGGTAEAKSLTVSGAGNTTLNGVISDGGSTALNLIHSGTGTTTLSGNNSYSGDTTLSGGTLNINSSTALGTGAFVINDGTTIDNTSGSAITLANNNLISLDGDFTFAGSGDLNLGAGNVTLTANRTVTVSGGELTLGGVIDDGASDFSLGTAGAGTLVLNGANTYGGDTTIGAGVNLRAGNSQAFGTAGTVILTGDNAELELADGVNVGNDLTASNVGGEKVIRLAAAATSAEYSGNIDKQATGVLDFKVVATSGQTLTLSGIISNNNASDVSVTEAGTVVLSGNNTFDNEIRIFGSGATVRLEHNNAAGVGSGTGISVRQTGTVELGDGVNIARGLTTTTAGGGKNLVLVSGATSGEWSGAIVNLDHSAAFSVTSTDTGVLTLSGNITGAGNLNKTGTGKVILSGSAVNAYTDYTKISDGMLIVDSDNSAATGAVTVESGGTLGGSGTIGGAVSVDGTIAPGNAGVGTLTVNNSVTFNDESALTVEVDSTTCDKLLVFGDVSLGDGSSTFTTLNLSGLPASNPGTGYQRVILACDGTLSGLFENASGTALTDGAQIPGQSIYYIHYVTIETTDYAIITTSDAVPTSSGIDLRAFQTAEGVAVEFVAYDVEADGIIRLALLGADRETVWEGDVAVTAGPQFVARFLVPGLELGGSYDFLVRDEVGKWWDANGVTVGSFEAEMTRATLTGITLTFDSLPDRDYEIQWLEELGGTWQTVTNIHAGGATTSVVVEYPDPSNPSGFFRVLSN